jgi:hypothetical protein
MRQNPNDKIREAILGLLYSIHQKARGIKSTSIGISKIKQALKKQGFKGQEVVSNLDYLVQTKWVVREVEEYPLKRSGITITARRVTYKISDIGINHFQGVSNFQSGHKFENINVLNIQGVTVIGENNIVYDQHTDLFRHLDILDTEIQKSDQLKDEDKLSCHADIETIKSQLAKPKPNREILKIAWEGVKAAATVGGVVGLCQTIATLIAPLLA